MLKSLSLYFQLNILRIILFGIINGTTLLISSNTINFWLASHKIDIEIIGFFSLIIIPQALKYFIAIFIDYTKIPFLSKNIGHHRAWLIISQIFITIILFYFGFLNPIENLISIAVLGFIFSFFSVVQYVILNGNRILILNPHEQGAGVAIYNVGHRIGMFIASAGVIYLSIFLNWKMIFITLTVLYTITSLFVLGFYQEPKLIKEKDLLSQEKRLLKNIFLEPIKRFEGYRNFIWIVFFVLIYQLSDTMMMTMLNPFLLFKEYSQEEIATASKTCSLIMVIIGGVIGGVITSKGANRNSLISLAIVHTLSYVLFLILSFSEKNILLLYIASGYTALTGGMATTAYFSFISALSHGKNATSLYALLSSLIGAAWAIFPAFSGVLADNFGWTVFFAILCVFSALIIIYTYLMPRKIFALEVQN